MAQATLTAKQVLMTATVTPASGGFGMYDTGEASVWPLDYRATDAEAQFETAQDAVDAYLEEARDSDTEIEKTAELDGKIYNQNDADIYTNGNGSYFAVWTIDAAGGE